MIYKNKNNKTFMKKPFIILLMVVGTFINSVFAQGTWEAACVKQGPARGYVAGSLKPGGVAKPVRQLTSAILPSLPGPFPIHSE